MPKSSDKTKGAKKRKNSNADTEGDQSAKVPTKKKKKAKKSQMALEGIEMSKQLASQLENKRTTRPRKTRNQSKRTSEPRLLGNGKPMPSLSELEAMYTDSDGDEDIKVPAKEIETCSDDRCSTPTSNPILNEINLDSPKTLKEFTSKVIDIISQKVIELDDDQPRPPVIPKKKLKKSDKPYIVGCKDRRQVQWKPKTKFCVGFGDFGIDENQSPDEDDEPTKRKKRGKKINLSKSIFNAKSDEIAERLQELDTFDSRTESPDSNKTEDYYLPTVSPETNKSFSPLPSTSRDTVTFEKNDLLFQESLDSSSLPAEFLSNNSNDSQNSIEIIDPPCETVVIDDSLPVISVTSEKLNYIDIEDEDCCILDEPNIKRKRLSEEITISDSPPRDEIYGSIDLTQTYENEVYEINDDDIDNLLAETKVILNKDLQKRRIDTITNVDPNIIVIGSENNNDQQSSSSSNVDCTEVISRPSNLETYPYNGDDIASTLETHTSNPTQNDQSLDIVQVVTNFFKRPPDPKYKNIPNCPGSYIAKDNIIRRISSWMNSFETLLTPQQNHRQNLNTDDNDILYLGSSNQTATSSNDSVVVQMASPHTTNAVCESPPHLHNVQGTAKTLTPASVPHQEQPSTTESSSKGLDCPICMESLANNAIASTLCGHVFCMPCIKAAIKANGKKCPTCRKSLKGVGFHQLFL